MFRVTRNSRQRLLEDMTGSEVALMLLQLTEPDEGR